MINSIDSNTQFTSEKEDNGSIHFLDLNIIRNNISGNLNIKIYRKNTHTDKYLSFDSCNPIQHKESVVRSLLNRKNILCDQEFRDNEETYIKSALMKNNYIAKYINTVKKKNKYPQINRKCQQNDRWYVVAPYIKNVSERVAKIQLPFNIYLA